MNREKVLVYCRQMNREVLVYCRQADVNIEKVYCRQVVKSSLVMLRRAELVRQRRKKKEHARRIHLNEMPNPRHIHWLLVVRDYKMAPGYLPSKLIWTT